MEAVHVRVPATTANLGPGFDCLGLALDLWNEVYFEPGDQPGIQLTLSGLGAGQVPEDSRNLVARSAQMLFQAVDLEEPPSLKIHCINNIPLGSGLGSSAAATLSGLIGANAMLGNRLSPEEILHLSIQIEGHPDNATAAFYGGLILVAEDKEDYLVRQIDLRQEKLEGVSVALAIPQIHLPTRVARSALPKEVPLSDAVFNSAHTALVIEALRDGDLDLLGKAMQDRLHQPYRLHLVAGANDAMQAAREEGAKAVAISGAGPSLIAFGKGNMQTVVDRMVATFATANIPALGYILGISLNGVSVESVNQ